MTSAHVQNVLAVLLVIVSARLPDGIGDGREQASQAVPDLRSEHGESLGLPAAGRQVARVIFDGVVQQGREGQVRVGGRSCTMISRCSTRALLSGFSV